MDLGIKGKVALVLGGSQGIALSAAAHLSKAATTTVLKGRDAKRSNTTDPFLPQNDRFVQGDGFLPKNKISIIDLIRSLAGAPDILILNPGAARRDST